MHNPERVSALVPNWLTTIRMAYTDVSGYHC